MPLLASHPCDRITGARHDRSHARRLRTPDCEGTVCHRGVGGYARRQAALVGELPVSCRALRGQEAVGASVRRGPAPPEPAGGTAQL